MSAGGVVESARSGARPGAGHPNMRRKEALAGFAFISPWLLGLLVFTAGPVLASLYLGFTEYDLFNPPKWIGIENYVDMFSKTREYWIAVRVTLIYTAVSVPGHLAAGYLVALMLNQHKRIPAISAIRAIYYLPAIVPAVATYLLWTWIFHSEYGLLNWVLSPFGGKTIAWLADPKYALWALIIMSFWGIGGSMVIYLSGLQGVPTELYEAASIDGAGAFQRFLHVTIPYTTPVIFFNLIMGIIGSFQTFGAGYIMTRGGPANSTLFYALYLYFQAFTYAKMGFAAAMAWVLFLVIMSLTVMVFRTSGWVYYSGEVRGR